MIRINLLPYEYRPIKRTPLPYILTVGIMVGAIVVLMMWFFAGQREIWAEEAQLSANKSELESLRSVVEEYQELAAKQRQLSAKIEAIQNILANRIVWSKQVENLAAITPDNMWYTRLRVIWKSRPEWVIRETRDGKQEREQVSVRRPFLEMSGYVAPDEEGSKDLYPLTNALATDEEFSRRYEHESTRFVDETIEGRPVREFTLEYLIKTEGTGK